MQQKNIQIGSVDVPIILNGGEEWYPVSYVTTKILLRSGKNGLINKHNKERFKCYIQNYSIKYGDKNKQESRCINKEGLVKALEQTHVGRLTVNQRISQNQLHSYLGLNPLPIEEQDSLEYKKEWFSEGDDYTKDVIRYELKNEIIKWFRMCSKCNFHYPLTNRFFPIDNRADKGFSKVCRVCSGNIEFFAHQDNDKNILRKQQLELYKAMNEDQIMKIFDAYLSGKIKRLPDCYENKESYLRIIEELFVKGSLNENNLTLDNLVNNYKLKGVNRHLKIEEIYSALFGEDFYCYAWKYPVFQFRNIKLTYEIANKILRNYINENKIEINDIFTYNYVDLFTDCKLRKITDGNILAFIVQFYDYKYAGYLFKTTSVNYYKREEHLLFDLKYLIEQDMELNIDKIPLYLTKYTLQRKCSPLYRYIITNKKGSIYEWVNKLYPNKFVIHDFEISPIRNEFDSDTEMYIHDILVKEFGSNVIYNQRNNDRTIKLKGKMPDWLLFTNKGVWVIEYFGMLDDRYRNSSRIQVYHEKYQSKINTYETLQGYNFLYLYLEDIGDDYKGIREKIAKLKEMLGT